MTNYANGRGREYEVRDDLRGNGYKVVRTRGSHGPMDLIAHKPGEWLLVQVKPPGGGTIPPKDRAELLDWAGQDATPLVAYRPAKYKPYIYRRLTGPGPKDWTEWSPDWAVTS
jgi:Holliday junction resolvase